MRTCLLYTHFTFGIGHYVRARRIAAALAQSGRFKVHLAISGVPIVQETIPGVLQHWLPWEVRMGTRSSDVITELDHQQCVQQRIRALREAICEYRPDIFITEYFPFGYSRLEQTLIPVLEIVPRSCKVVCSCRDFPISDRENKAELNMSAVVSILSEYYDLVLVHAPREQSAFHDGGPICHRKLGVPVLFTDYIGPVMDEASIDPRNRFLFVSWAGGRDGREMVWERIRKIVDKLPIDRIVVASGPFGYFNDSGVRRVHCVGNVQDASLWVANAGAVASMAGYNTVAEIFASGTGAVLFPRRSSYEQTARANAIARQADNIFVASDSTGHRTIYEMLITTLETPRQPRTLLGSNETVNAILEIC